MSSPAPGAPRAKTPPRSGWVIAALCTGTALSALNSGMTAVSLSTLRQEFAVDVATVTWVISAFYLTSAVLQPLMGRLADEYGARRVFAAGMVITIIAGALGPFASTFAWLLAVRILLGIGTATTFPAAAAMLHAIAARSGGSAPKMIGRIQLIDTSSAAVGPVIGGVLLVLGGWQAIFWINIPLAAIALIWTHLLVPRDAPRARTPVRTVLRDADVPGILLFVVTIVALLVFLLDLTSDPNWLLVPVVLGAGALFTWRELRASTPFIDLRLLAANVALVRVFVVFILANLVFYSALFGIPPYLEDHAGYRTDVIGLLLLPLAAFNALVTPWAERLIDRRGLRSASSSAPSRSRSRRCRCSCSGSRRRRSSSSPSPRSSASRTCSCSSRSRSRSTWRRRPTRRARRPACSRRPGRSDASARPSSSASRSRVARVPSTGCCSRRSPARWACCTCSS